MDPKIKAVIDEITHLWEMQEMMMQEDREFVPPHERVLAVGPEGGQFLADLVRTHKLKRVLEIGTSHGYSTLYLADAVIELKGSVISYEMNEHKYKTAIKNIQQAGVGHSVSVIPKNILVDLPKTADTFDLVFIDGSKSTYIECFDMVKDKVRVGGFIVADNMNRPLGCRPLMKKYQEHVAADKNFNTHTEDIGWGLEVSKRISE